MDAMDTSDVQSGLKGVESDVYQMVKRCKDDTGIGIGELVRRFTPRENEHTLRYALPCPLCIS